MQKYTADYIYDPTTEQFLRNFVLSFDKEKVVELRPLREDERDVISFEGILCPGFINTHCHLELSHLKGIIPTGTGLLNFIGRVIALRNFEKEVIADAIDAADHEMYESGIVAVGDICNTVDTVEVKRTSSIRYHSFIELFDLMDSRQTQKTIDLYRKVYDEHHVPKSYVPHAPYSVTSELFHFVNSSNAANDVISIHNQEVSDENAMFMKGSGSFYEFYESIGLSLAEFEPIGKSSIHYALEQLDSNKPVLLVHNTMTSEDDIKFAHVSHKSIYWSTCPSANLYIENRLPDYQAFVDQEAVMTIGTDSLTSNWQLSIWEEIKCIKKYNSYLSIEQLLKWATLNGAHALGFTNELGSFEKGKNPGLVLIDCSDPTNEAAIMQSNSKRITLT